MISSSSWCQVWPLRVQRRRCAPGTTSSLAATALHADCDKRRILYQVLIVDSVAYHIPVGNVEGMGGGGPPAEQPKKRTKTEKYTK